MKKHLVPEWRKALTWLSVQWNILCVIAVPAWFGLSEEQKLAVLAAIHIPPGWVVAASFVIGIVLRLTAQGGAKDAPTK